ncbi:MAG: hypothetical protein V4692_14245, partial [Bdellovibrionota bacterium]
MHLIKAHFNIAKNILMGAFAILAVVFFGSSSFAANAGITYQGRILKPNGDVLSGAMTQFRVQIRTPNAANCLMFEEVHLLDMSSSNGLFSLTINDGSTTRTDISGYGLDRIFGNRGTFTFDPTTCSSGSNYIPNAEDGRKLQVYFKDETMASFEPMPPQTINYVPLALEAKQVAGFGIESLVRVQDGGGAMGNIAPLSNAAYTELLALTAGTSTQFNITSAKITDGTITGADLATNITVNTTNSVTAGGFTTTGNIVAANVSSSVGATREFQLVDPDDATAGAKRIKMVAPLAIASDYTLTWPLDDGTPGQMLTTDGAGVLSWTTAGIQAIVGSALGTGKIWVGAAGVAAEVTPSGDVTMTSAGAFTVATVGGSTAANIGTAEALANAATAASTNSAIVKRDPAGSFLSSSAKFTSSMILKDGAAGGEITLAAPTAFTSYALTLPVDDGTPSQVLTTNGTGTLSWTTPTTGTGDFKADGSVPMTGGIVALGTGSSAAPALTFAGSTTTGLWASGSQLSLASNGATRIRMSNNGNVGVNNSFASAYGFSAGYDVGMMGSNSGLNQFDLSTSGGNDRVTHAAGAGWRFGYYGEAHATTAVRGDLDISFYSGGVKSQAIYADRSGYVGFGTTTPTRQVDVAGPIRIAATALPGTPGTGDIAIDSADSNKLKWYNGSAWQTVGTGAGAGDFMANGSVPMTGNFTIDVSASTNAAPRIWGTGALVAGNASRVQIGDNSNVVQTGHSRKMQLASYWGMEIGGTRQASGSPAFVAGAATDPSLNVYGTTIGAPVLTATAASGQTANLQEWRGFGGTALSAVNALGHLGLGTATPAGILHVDGGTAAAGVNGTNISISAQTGGAGGGTRGGDITLNPGLSSNWEVGGMLKVGTNNPNASISLSSNSNGAYLSSSSQRTIVGQN